MQIQYGENSEVVKIVGRRVEWSSCCTFLNIKVASHSQASKLRMLRGAKSSDTVYLKGKMMLTAHLPSQTLSAKNFWSTQFIHFYTTQDWLQIFSVEIDCMHFLLRLIACILVTSSHLTVRQIHNMSNKDLIYYLRCISGDQMQPMHEQRVVYMVHAFWWLIIGGSPFHCLHTAWIESCFYGACIF